MCKGNGWRRKRDLSCGACLQVLQGKFNFARFYAEYKHPVRSWMDRLDGLIDHAQPSPPAAPTPPVAPLAGQIAGVWATPPEEPRPPSAVAPPLKGLRLFKAAAWATRALVRINVTLNIRDDLAENVADFQLGLAYLQGITLDQCSPHHHMATVSQLEAMSRLSLIHI